MISKLAFPFALIGLTLPAAVACQTSAPPNGPAEAATATPQPQPSWPEGASTGQAVSPGEHARYVVNGDTIVVNNEICAVSRSPMGPESLGQFVSRVQYRGSDPRFVGKTLEFNQCCGMCLQRFPELWAQQADEILAYHGLAADFPTARP